MLRFYRKVIYFCESQKKFRKLFFRKKKYSLNWNLFYKIFCQCKSMLRDFATHITIVSLLLVLYNNNCTVTHNWRLRESTRIHPILMQTTLTFVSYITNITLQSATKVKSTNTYALLQLTDQWKHVRHKRQRCLH